jgi:hypothetical protein
MTNSISLTFLKIRSRPCSWWSRRKTPLPPPWLKFPTLLFKIHAPHRCFFCQPLLKRQHPTLVCPLSLEREGWKMVAGGGSVAVPPLPRCGLKPPWVATGQIYCSCGIPPPRPPLIVAPSGRCSCAIHPRPKVCISCSGLVVVCSSLIVGKDQVASCSSRPYMEVVKSVKIKPPEVVSLVLPWLRVQGGRRLRKALLAAQCLRGIFPNFKSRGRSSRKLEWCPLLPVCRYAHRLPIRPGPLLSSIGRLKCHE